MAAVRILALARTRRWATVASGWRKARAISTVCSPHTRRSVSADLGGGGEGGVAAREDQPELVVVDRLDLARPVHGSASSDGRAGRRVGRPARRLLAAGAVLPPGPVEGPVACRGRDPGAGSVRARRGAARCASPPRTPPAPRPRRRRGRPAAGPAWRAPARTRRGTPARPDRASSARRYAGVRPGSGARPLHAASGRSSTRPRGRPGSAPPGPPRRRGRPPRARRTRRPPRPTR